MLLKKILISFFFFLFILTPPSLAFEPFIKSSNNPLQFSNNFQNWNELGKYQPSVLYENGIFKMWYASYNGRFKIVYTTSSDGINWMRQKLYDFTPGFDNHDPTILKTQNGYDLYFGRSENGGRSNFKLFRISSLDGINFNSNTLQEILSPSNYLEGNAVSSPNVIIKNGTYYLFYLCWGSQGFNVCLATSPDGNQWNRCPNNPIINSADGPHIFEKDGKFHLLFQEPPGVKQVESSNSLSCNMSWENKHTILLGGDPYDSVIIGPSLTEVNNKLYLYYSGLSSTGWTINLATSELPVQNNLPIILLPGLFGSWNKEAILHNQNVNAQNWKLNPIVNEYKGIIKTFSNLGYQQNQNFFIFSYDWRKSLNDISDDLNNFLSQSVYPANPKINLLGHSLGGLVSRIYGQKYGTQNIEKIITVGSPHQGTAQTYRAVEAGEFDKNDQTQWLTQKIILNIYKNKTKTDREILNNFVPIVKDLYPTFNFLVDQNNNGISIQDMQIKNNVLSNYNLSISDIFPFLQTIVGEKGNTLYGFKVKPRTTLDALLDIYPDGRPIENRYQTGDYVVLSSSAKADIDFKILNFDHGEIVYKKEAIKEILNSLNVPFQDSQIEEGGSTKIFPSIIFLILSPASMQVEFAGQNYDEQDGMIFIADAESGEYTLKIKGQQPGGKYTVLIGQNGTESDSWISLDGYINQDDPESQLDSYNVSFNSNSPLDYPVNQNDVKSLFDLLIKKLILLNQNNRFLDKAIKNLKEAKENYNSNDLKKLRENLRFSHKSIFQTLDYLTLEFTDDLLNAVVQLENLYGKSLVDSNPKPSAIKLGAELAFYKNTTWFWENFLLFKKQKKEDITEKANLLILAKEKLEKAENNLNQNNLNYAEVLLMSVKELLNSVKSSR